MITKVQRGRDVGRLLRYLFDEPGRDGTHEDARLVASWDGDSAAWEPPRLSDGRRDLAALAEAMGVHLRPVPTPFGVDVSEMVKIPKPVYHVSVALARADAEHGLPADPHLSDARFAEIVTDLMVRVGIHGEGVDDVRWVAVRHDVAGASHAHVVATLASADGQPVRPWDDYYKLGDGCRVWERRLGLRPTGPRDGSGPRDVTYAEREKARRKGWREPTKLMLAEQVRAVAAGSESVEDFMRRLAAEGVRTKLRVSDSTGLPTGYRVGVSRTARDGTVEDLWFSGGKLAHDLSLPQLRKSHGWVDGSRSEPTPLAVDRDELWAEAVEFVTRAADAVYGFRNDPVAAASAAHAAADFVAGAARLFPGRDGEALRDAATYFARAGISAPVPAPSAAGAGLRLATRMLLAARFIASEDTQRLLALLAQLSVLADAMRRMREEQGRFEQAEAARRAHERLGRGLPSYRPEPLVGVRRESVRLKGMTL